MQNLKALSNQELDLKLGLFLKKENLLLKESLLHIQEADRRRLYLQFGYPSLYEYLTKHHRYSDGNAQRRIDAARLGVVVPALLDFIALNEINLSQVALVQKAFRQYQKQNKCKVSIDVKRQVIESLKQKSLEESQYILAKRLNLKIQASPKVSKQADESVRFEVTFSKAQWGKMIKMRELLSHSVPYGGWEEVIEYVADKVIKSKSPHPTPPASQKSTERRSEEARQPSPQPPRRPSSPPSGSENKTEQRSAETQPPQSTSQMKSEGSSEVSVSCEVSLEAISLYKLRKIVLHRDQCCQAKDSKSGQTCGSRWQLQVDHIKPRWAGGKDQLENLQALCAKHNRAKYRQQANIQ
jgi:hypothetical protein